MQHGSELIFICVLHDGEAFIKGILHIDEPPVAAVSDLTEALPHCVQFLTHGFRVCAETSSQAADCGLHPLHVIGRSGQFPA
jgi:hypothetical protein